MNVNKELVGTTLTLKVEGRLDTTTAPEFETIINDSVAGVTKLVLDFQNLEYISSAGLRVVLSAQKIMNKQGEMVVTNVNETVMVILEVTGFTDILTIE